MNSEIVQTSGEICLLFIVEEELDFGIFGRSEDNFDGGRSSNTLDLQNYRSESAHL